MQTDPKPANRIDLRPIGIADADKAISDAAAHLLSNDVREKVERFFNIDESRPVSSSEAAELFASIPESVRAVIVNFLIRPRGNFEGASADSVKHNRESLLSLFPFFRDDKVVEKFKRNIRLQGSNYDTAREFGINASHILNSISDVEIVPLLSQSDSGLIPLLFMHFKNEVGETLLRSTNDQISSVHVAVAIIGALFEQVRGVKDSNLTNSIDLPPEYLKSLSRRITELVDNATEVKEIIDNMIN